MEAVLNGSAASVQAQLLFDTGSAVDCLMPAETAFKLGFQPRRGSTPIAVSGVTNDQMVVAVLTPEVSIQVTLQNSTESVVRDASLIAHVVLNDWNKLDFK